tara:strand:+ start:825 stop:1259 length:435 start_codon:yes stop_codon:yes gene_type:complete
MKRYEYDGSVKQQADVICYAFSPDLLDASEKELKSFLKMLSRYFPQTDNGEGGYEPMDNRALLDTFNSAHRHVCELIDSKRAQKRHRWLLGVSIATLLVLAATLGNTVVVQSSETSQTSKTLNQSFKFVTGLAAVHRTPLSGAA